MRRTCALAWLAALALVLAAAAAGCQQKPVTITVRFANLDGLEKGDPVLFRGAIIGKVADVRFGDDGRFAVQIAVAEKFSAALTDNSRFSIGPDPAAAGGKAVVVELEGQGGNKLASGAVVDGFEPRPAAWADQLEKSIEQGIEVLGKMADELRRKVDETLDDQAIEDLRRQLEQLGQKARQAGEQARRKIVEEVLPDIERRLEELRRKLAPSGRQDRLKPLEKEIEAIRRI